MTATPVATDRIATLRDLAYDLGRDCMFVFNTADDAIRAGRGLSQDDVKAMRDRTARFRLGAGDALIEEALRPIPQKELPVQNTIADAVADVYRALQDVIYYARGRKKPMALRHAADTAQYRLFAIYRALLAVTVTE